MDRYTTEPQSEGFEPQRDFSNYMEEPKEKNLSTPARETSKSHSTQQNYEATQRDRPPLTDMEKNYIKMTKQKKPPSKMSQANKIGKNINNLYKKGMSKHIRAAGKGNSNQNLAQSTDQTKKKYSKSQAFKTYNELVQIMQNMSKFDWIEAAGITNKSQLGILFSLHLLIL